MMLNLNVRGAWLLGLLAASAFLNGLMLGSRELFNPAEARRRSMELELQRQIQALEIEKQQRRMSVELEAERERLHQKNLLDYRRETLQLYVEFARQLALIFTWIMTILMLSFCALMIAIRTIWKLSIARYDEKLWSDPNYRRYRRELARAMEQISRKSGAGRPFIPDGSPR